MKSFLILTVLLGSISAKADTILCNFQNRPLFGIAIEVNGSIPKQGFENHDYPSLVTFSGPRLHQVSKEILTVEYINTRTDVGIAYHVDLGQETEIDLVNIWFHPQGKTYFTGHYSEDGKKQNLVCKYAKSTF